MANIGAKLSESGYPVLTASDKQMIFHSSFYNLKIFMQGAFTNVAAGGVIATHNLGFVPIFLVFRVNSGQSKIVPTIEEDGSIIKGGAINNTDLINDNSGAMSGYYYIFKQELNATLSPVTVDATDATKTTESADYGIKVSKTGYDVKTALPKNLIMTSGRKVVNETARLHIIHRIDTGALAGSPYNNTITHNLSYVPQSLWYALINSFGDNRWRMVNNALDSYITISTTQSSLYLPYAGNYACVIFKDKGV